MESESDVDEIIVAQKVIVMTFNMNMHFLGCIAIVESGVGESS